MLADGQKQNKVDGMELCSSESLPILPVWQVVKAQMEMGGVVAPASCIAKRQIGSCRSLCFILTSRGSMGRATTHET